MNRVDFLTDGQLAGQRLIVGFQGKALNDELRFMIKNIGVGGVILFKRNVSDPTQLAELCQAIQAFSMESGNLPLIIAIDQEGGAVARLDPPFTVFPGNRAIGQAQSKTYAVEFGRITAIELKRVGINVNFAPVLDVVPQGLDSPIMGDRVFGHKPELVAELGTIVIENLQKNGVAATAKHFPGIGRTTVDSHVDLPFLDTKRHMLESNDLVPFRAAVRDGVEVVMLSHVVYRDLDPTWPASLSPVIAKDLLREAMGFRGITITDDLDMGAIDKHYSVDTFVRKAYDAEIDILLICHDQTKIEATYAAMLKIVQESEDLHAKALASVRRIMNLKKRYTDYTTHR